MVLEELFIVQFYFTTIIEFVNHICFIIISYFPNCIRKGFFYFIKIRIVNRC